MTQMEGDFFLDTDSPPISSGRQLIAGDVRRAAIAAVRTVPAVATDRQSDTTVLVRLNGTTRP